MVFAYNFGICVPVHFVAGNQGSGTFGAAKACLVEYQISQVMNNIVRHNFLQASSTVRSIASESIESEK